MCAAVPKERRRYSSKCTDLIKQVETKVLQYNLLLPHGQCTRQPAVLEDVRQCTFAWIEEYGEGWWQWCRDLEHPMTYTVSSCCHLLPVIATCCQYVLVQLGNRMLQPVQPLQFLTLWRHPV